MSTMQEKTYRPVLTEAELRVISAALIAPARETYHAQLAKFTIDRMLLRINKRKLEYGSSPAAPVLPTAGSSPSTPSNPSTSPTTPKPIPTEQTNMDWIQYIKDQTENPSPETLEAEQLAKGVSPHNQGPLDLSDLE